MCLIAGYLDSELYLKENASGDKPVKKARGGVASRKAKANSIAAHAVRSKAKAENASSQPQVGEQSTRSANLSKAGDLSFVLNDPSASSPPRHASLKSSSTQPSKQQQNQSTPGSEQAQGFAPTEPAHNRTSLILPTDVSSRTHKKAKGSGLLLV